MVWWKRSTFPQVVGWFGRLFFWTMPRLSRRCSKPLRPPLPPEQPGGEHHPVVSQRRGRDTVCFQGVREGVDDDGTGDSAVGGDRDRVAGVVIEPAQDLDVGAVGEPPVGEVGLPALVRQVGLEPDVGRLRPLLRFDLGDGQAAQDPVDRRSRHGDLVVLGEVPADRVGAGIEPVGVSSSRSSRISSTVVDGVDRGSVRVAASVARTRRRPRPGSGRRARRPTSGPRGRSWRRRTTGDPRRRQR